MNLNLGILHRRLEDINKALKYLEIDRIAQDIALGKNSIESATINHIIGVIHSELKNPEKE